MTAQRRYDLLINESEAVGFDHCKRRASELAEFSFMISVRLQVKSAAMMSGSVLLGEQMSKVIDGLAAVSILD